MDTPFLIDPASNFTSTLQPIPSLPITSLSLASYGQHDLTIPHIAFRNLFTACTAMVSQRMKWNTTHEVAMVALQQAESGRALVDEFEVYLMQEMRRVVQVVQGQVSLVRIEQFSPLIKAECAGVWNEMVASLLPNLENTGVEYSKEGYVEPLDAGDAGSNMESEE
jgi:hypothetical protein